MNGYLLKEKWIIRKKENVNHHKVVFDNIINKRVVG